MNSFLTNVSDLKDTGLYHDIHAASINLRQQAQQDGDKALKSAVKEFESYFFSLILKNMRSTNQILGEESPLNNKNYDIYHDMHDKQISLLLAKSSSLGLGDLLYQQLSKLNHSSKPEEVSKITQVYPVENKTALLADTQVVNTQKNQLDVKEIEVETINIEQSVMKDDVSHNKTASYTHTSFDSKEDFISQLLPFAKKAAQLMGVAPGLLIAQAALETGWGKSIHSKQGEATSNNLFGIKADTRWQGNKVTHSTIEFEQGMMKRLNQMFRAYESIKASFEDYVDFILTQPRYQKALSVSHEPEQYIQEIQDAGYATDPDYADKVLSIYKRESLDKIQE